MVTHTPVTHSRKAIFAVLSRTSFYLLVFIYLLFVLFPVVWIFLMSIKLPVDITAYPPKLFFEPTWQNYVKLFSSESNVGGQAFVHYLYRHMLGQHCRRCRRRSPSCFFVGAVSLPRGRQYCLYFFIVSFCSGTDDYFAVVY